jgi:hypothetical protein
VTDEQAREVRAAEAVEHLQQAALELIAAMRVVLDLAEEAVKDPEPLVGMASSTAQGLLAALVRLGADGGVGRDAHAAGDQNGGDGAGAARRSSGVQRIRVS